MFATLAWEPRDDSDEPELPYTTARDAGHTPGGSRRLRPGAAGRTRAGLRRPARPAAMILTHPAVCAAGRQPGPPSRAGPGARRVRVGIVRGEVGPGGEAPGADAGRAGDLLESCRAATRPRALSVSGLLRRRPLGRLPLPSRIRAPPRASPVARPRRDGGGAPSSVPGNGGRGHANGSPSRQPRSGRPSARPGARHTKEVPSRLCRRSSSASSRCGKSSAPAAYRHGRAALIDSERESEGRGPSGVAIDPATATHHREVGRTTWALGMRPSGRQSPSGWVSVSRLREEFNGPRCAGA